MQYHQLPPLQQKAQIKAARGVAHMAKNKKKCAIPQHELEALAEVLYPSLKEYLLSPEGKAEFQKWQEQKRQEKKHT